MSNLIEQLGGYEAAKVAALNYKNSGDILAAKKFERACLEYRRAHNIFEVGDSIVIHENHDSTFMPVLEILEDCGDYFKTDNGIATKSHVGYW